MAGETWIWIGLFGLLVWLLDMTRLLGRLLGAGEAQAARAAYAAAAGVARAERTWSGRGPGVWELTPGCRFTVAAGSSEFGAMIGAGEFKVVGMRHVHQRVQDRKTAEWREFALVQADRPWLLVALKFMNKLVLMRPVEPADFAPGLTNAAEAERFVLRHNRAGMTLEGGPDVEPLTVGRVGPVRYAAEAWPSSHGGSFLTADSFLAGSGDKMHHLLARKEGGRLWLWYGRVVAESAVTVRLEEKGAGGA